MCAVPRSYGYSSTFLSLTSFLLCMIEVKRYLRQTDISFNLQNENKCLNIEKILYYFNMNGGIFLVSAEDIEFVT